MGAVSARNAEGAAQWAGVMYHWADWAPFGGEIPIWLSLTVILSTLAITTIASLLKSRHDADNADTTAAHLSEQSASVEGAVSEEEAKHLR